MAPIMLRRSTCRTFFILLFASGSVLLAGQKDMVPNTCFLYARVSIDEPVDLLLAAGFSKSLHQVLAQKFPAINLCMDSCRDSCSHLPLLKLQVSYKKNQDTAKNLGEIIVTSKNIMRYQKKKGSRITPLHEMQLITSFPVPAGADITGLYMIVAEKIVENVRQEALCEVKISVNPAGAHFFIDSNFTGTSPKTILLPPGTYDVRASASGYLPFSSDLDVQSSGITLFDAKLVKRRFYHSRYIYFFELFGAAAASSFAGEWYYYNRYRSFGERDFNERPDIFKNTFDTAKKFQYAGCTLLGLTGASLCLSFFF